MKSLFRHVKSEVRANVETIYNVAFIGVFLRLDAFA